LRKTDILGRWGGEEFLVLLPNTGIKHACEVAEKLREKIQNQPINELFCTISSGVKMLDEDDLSADMAVKRTDDALYEAKHLGRNRVVIYKNLPS
jgi:diguanylate cyclase (GGDEF)-like protein